MDEREYSVGKTYKVVEALILMLSPYAYFRFFDDLVRGDDGRHWTTMLAAFLVHPILMSLLLGLPTVAVFAGLVILTYRFVVDLVFPKRVRGILESAVIVKTKWFGDRIKIDVAGRSYKVLNDTPVAQLLLPENAIGKPIEMRIGGLNKVLYLRRN